MTKAISVVIPVYNGEAALPSLVERLETVLRDNYDRYEIILVNDFSSDASWEAIAGLCQRHSTVRGINLAKNFGQYAATVCGVVNARYDLVVTMDDDGQHRPEDIPKLQATFDEGRYDFVSAVFDGRRYGVLKAIGSEVVECLFRVLLKKPKNVRFSSFRLFGKVAKDAIVHDRSSSALIPAIALSATHRIGNTRLAYEDRLTGQSGMTLKSQAKITLDIIFYNSLIPLRAIVIASCLMMIAFFFGGVHVLVRAAMSRPDVAGWASLWVLISFSGGVGIAILGVLAEYVGRLIVETSRRPRYAIAEINESPSERKT